MPLMFGLLVEVSALLPAETRRGDSHFVCLSQNT